MIDFFIDTAHVDNVMNIWNKIENMVDPTCLKGITTNPNAFKKIDMFKLSEWEEHLPKLCKIVSKIKGNDLGVIYTQIPISTMSQEEILKFAKHISSFNDGNTKIGLKLPPFKHALELVPEIEHFMDTNITGIADVATALYAISFGPTYVSVIPGRMEEVGIIAKPQIRYLMNSNITGKTDIIAGSMRTIDGLKWVSEMGTVPTIGEKVWDLIFNDLTLLNDLQFKVYSLDLDVQHFSPNITNTNTNLSVAFFEQMDKFGKQCKKDFNIK